MKQFVSWSVVAVVAAPAAFVWAQSPGGDATGDRPTSRPAMAALPRFDRGYGRGDGLGPRGDGGPGGPGRRFVNPQEWADVEAFMRVNNPVRIEMLKKIEDALGPDRPISMWVRAGIIQRYREIDRKKSDAANPKVYESALKQLQSEDAVLGTLRDQRAPGANAAALDQKLNDQVRVFVDNNLAERQARIDRLKAILDAQTKSLEQDRGSVDALVVTQRDKFKKEMDAMLDFNANGGEVPTPATQPAKKSPG